MQYWGMTLSKLGSEEILLQNIDGTLIPTTHDQNEIKRNKRLNYLKQNSSNANRNIAQFVYRKWYTVSRGIWDKYHEPPRRVIFGELWNIMSRYLSQIPRSNRTIFCLYYKGKKFLHFTQHSYFYLVTRNWLGLQPCSRSFPFEYFTTVDKLSVLGNGNVAACFL